MAFTIMIKSDTAEELKKRKPRGVSWDFFIRRELNLKENESESGFLQGS